MSGQPVKTNIEEHDLHVATALGSIDATLKAFDVRLSKIETDLKSAVGTLNRYKGATGILIIVGGLLGWVANFFFKGSHS
jgi:hypothetical protein